MMMKGLDYVGITVSTFSVVSSTTVSTVKDAIPNSHMHATLISLNKLAHSLPPDLSVHTVICYRNAAAYREYSLPACIPKHDVRIYSLLLIPFLLLDDVTSGDDKFLHTGGLGIQEVLYY